MNLSENIRKTISFFLLIILPWVIIGLGLVLNVASVWYYLLSILWFGMGFIFYGALN
ncbi:MAG: hypothetical protein QHH19_05515 [Candidatus Thermoplasmatota archaeon]|nr:hypothetical protein [Candidatus Thermoplasmatota archaeon]